MSTLLVVLQDHEAGGKDNGDGGGEDEVVHIFSFCPPTSVI
jgi:hypothetical protein